MDFLSEIIAAKRRRVEAAKARVPIERMRELAQLRFGSRQFTSALHDRDRPNIIAEFKRRSPSKGRINSAADPASMAQIYESAGAAAISVLTEEDYFDGSLDDLRQVCEATSLPVLRKDFILDEYQVYESAAAGADALLLIVTALDDQTLKHLRCLAEDDLGMDALVEVHSLEEFERAVASGARLIGVNNRNLRTFEVSSRISNHVAYAASPDVTLVSESGLIPELIPELQRIGYRGFLVGEVLMRARDPAVKIRQFMGEPGRPSSYSPGVKICGITNLEDARAAIEAGADLLGLNFYRASPRYIEPRAAREIIEIVRSETATEPWPQMIGVFVNESMVDIFRIVSECALDGVQLHGNETIEFCAQLKKEYPQGLVYKAVSATEALDLQALRKYSADAILIDAFDPQLLGGTGRIADWTIAREAAELLPFLILAGGLSPENVAEAIARVQPDVVDACSALEVSPGKKDHARMKEFVAAVRAVKLPDEVSASQ